MTHQEDIRQALFIGVVILVPCAAMLLWVLVPEAKRGMREWVRRR